MVQIRHTTRVKMCN